MINEDKNRRNLTLVAVWLPLALAGCASAAPAPYPTFAEIPSVPGDVRSPAEWRRNIIAVRADGVKLASETSPNTFTLNDTEAFAARIRAQASKGGTAPNEVTGRAQADAFVNAARGRALTPPSTR
jgi:hypothetical protein